MVSTGLLLPPYRPPCLKSSGFGLVDRAAALYCLAVRSLSFPAGVLSEGGPEQQLAAVQQPLFLRRHLHLHLHLHLLGSGQSAVE